MRYGLFNERGFMVDGPYPSREFVQADREAHAMMLCIYDFWLRRTVRDYRPVMGGGK